jgi:hypothetical protein
MREHFPHRLVAGGGEGWPLGFSPPGDARASRAGAGVGLSRRKGDDGDQSGEVDRDNEGDCDNTSDRSGS